MSILKTRWQVGELVCVDSGASTFIGNEDMVLHLPFSGPIVASADFGPHRLSRAHCLLPLPVSPGAWYLGLLPT